jgi:hypothetical protein
MATARVAMQPINQPVEMVDRARAGKARAPPRSRRGALTGEGGWKATFAFRAGLTCGRPREPEAASGGGGRLG